MISLGDALLGKYPSTVTSIAGQKRGRGRPRKIVDRDGIYIHKRADEKSDRKMIAPKMRHEITHRFSELNIKYPKAGTVTVVSKIASEFKLTYAQVYELVV